MNKITTFWEDTAKVWLHEMRDMFKDEGALLFVILLPLAYPLLYSWIYNNEVVREVPVAVVDNSHSQTSREFVRHVDASPDVRVAAWSNNLEEASRLVARQEVYGIILLPEDFDRQLGRMQQAHVSVYCNMGLMLTYKAIFQTCSAVAADMNSHIQIALSGNPTTREDQLTTHPMQVSDVPIFNNTGGYGNFILPGVLVLIIQQVMLLGIGIAYGTSYEKRRFSRLTPMYERRFGLARIMIGRTMGFFVLFLLIAAWVLLAVPRMFHFVQMLHFSDFLLFVVPYLLACVFFATTFSFFIRQRENVMLLVVFTSVPFLFMSGVSWPKSNIPEVWQWVSWLFPSTFGIQGFIKMNTLGGVFGDIIPEIKGLWIQTVIYGVFATLVTRWQVKKREK
ncbi:ABC transporter permease [uncultured Prevotella sp.]|uniref:ABC transporter permease n=1 Tax=uncultured Prevotella sp. TaxID=159272 RepID=UPI0027E342AD|nr:ABC transporter permease [uncultured Prevotella sp.]